jgi:hypothetical protein
LRTLNRDGAGGALWRLEAKLGPDLRGGQEREIIPDENDELCLLGHYDPWCY